MSERPDDVPEDVWQAACAVESIWSNDGQGISTRVLLQDGIARAILAERSAQRERDAQIAENRWRMFDTMLASGNVEEHLHERAVGRAFEGQHIASAIRNPS